MTRARDLSRFTHPSAVSVEAGTFNIGIGSDSPDVKLDVIGSIEASGISTFQNNLFVGAGITMLASSGIVSAVSFYGDGSALTGIDATSLKDDGGNIKVQANPSGAVVTGVLTATSFDGDGSALTGVASTDNIITDTLAQFNGAVGIADSIFHIGDTNTAIRFPTTDTFTLEIGGSEAFRSDNSRRVLVGTSTARTTFFNDSIAPKVQIEGYDEATSSLSIYSNENNSNGSYLFLGKGRGGSVGSATQVSNGDRLGSLQFSGLDQQAHVMCAAEICAEVDGTPAGSGEDMPGRLMFFTMPDGSGTTIPTERMRITSGGNIFAAGNTDQNWSTNGFSVITNEGFAFTKSTNSTFGGICILKRASAVGDGNLIEFLNASGQQGTISISGSTVQLNGAHLARWSQLLDGGREEILRGTVLTNLDEMCEWAYDAEPEVLWAEGDELPEGVSVGDVKTPAKAAGTEDNEQLNRMKVSDAEGDPNVAGVFVAWDDDDDTYTDDFYCAMTGDFVIRIAQGVTVERGDLLMSAGDGTAKPQDDDIIRSKTIAKVTSTHVSETYADGSYCVPCVLMAC